MLPRPFWSRQMLGTCQIPFARRVRRKTARACVKDGRGGTLMSGTSYWAGCATTARPATLANDELIQPACAARQVSPPVTSTTLRSMQQLCALENTCTYTHYYLRISGLRSHAPLDAMQHAHATELDMARPHDVVNPHTSLCCVVRARRPRQASRLQRAA